MNMQEKVKTLKSKRDVEIYKNELLDFNEKDEFTILVHVSKGTYIRSLAYDIGKSLGTFASLTELRRIRTGSFKIEDAIKVSDFEKSSLDEIKEKILPMDLALMDFKRIDIPKSFCDKFIMGQFYKLKRKIFLMKIIEFIQMINFWVLEK